MVICFISNTSWSLFNFRKNLILELKEKGYKIYIISSHDRTSNEFIKIGCIPVNLKLSQQGINIFKEFITIFKLFMILKRIRPDYILNFTIKPIIYTGLINYLYKFKTISTLDGLGHAFPKNSKLFFNFSKILLRLSIKKNLYFLAVNKSDYNFYKVNRICKESKLKIIPGTGIDLNYYKLKDSKKNKKITFIMISRILKIKGVDLFLELAKNFQSDKKIEFILVTPGKFLNYSYELNLKCIKYKDLNIIKHSEDVLDIRKVLSKADCLIHPTSYNEGLPRVILEASAMNIPTITTNTAGCIDIIKDKFSGLICSQNDLKCLIKNVNFFCNLSEIHRTNLGNNARNTVEKKFNEIDVIKNYVNLINE